MSGVKKPIKHGTIGGYMAHKRREEVACASCTAAWRRYYQDRNNSLPRSVRTMKNAKEKHVKILRKAAKMRECEVRKQKRRERRYGSANEGGQDG